MVSGAVWPGLCYVSAHVLSVDFSTAIDESRLKLAYKSFDGILTWHQLSGHVSKERTFSLLTVQSHVMDCFQF